MLTEGTAEGPSVVLRQCELHPHPPLVDARGTFRHLCGSRCLNGGKSVDWSELFFQGWSGIIRTLIVGTLAYVVLVLFVRISGKRTLAKMNAFDLVVTVALGSTLSAVLLQEAIALAEGATALGLLIALQYLVTFLSVRSKDFAKLVRSQPTLLARSGSYCSAALLDQRLTEDEVLSAVRSQGLDDLDQVEAVILESDGSLSVIPRKG